MIENEYDPKALKRYIEAMQRANVVIIGIEFIQNIYTKTRLSPEKFLDNVIMFGRMYGIHLYQHPTLFKTSFFQSELEKEGLLYWFIEKLFLGINTTPCSTLTIQENF